MRCTIMNKRFISLLCAALLLLSLVGGASAVEPRASTVISSYGISLEADGNSEMTVNFRVYAPKVVAQLGAMQIEIKYLDGDTWRHYDTFTATANPNFYDYDSAKSNHSKTFTGTAGTTYQAFLTAYSKGYDGTTAIRTAESQTAVCY